MDKNELELRLESAEKQNLGLLDEIKNLVQDAHGMLYAVYPRGRFQG